MNFDLYATAAMVMFIVGLAATMYYEKLSPKSRPVDEAKPETHRDID